MTAVRLPARVRVGVIAVLVLLIAAIVAMTVTIRYGASALQVTDGDEVSVAATGRTWFGLEVENPSTIPLTLRSFRAVVASNARIVDVRVLDHERVGGGIGAVSPPLDADSQADVDSSSPVAGFVVPAHSRSRYELIVLLERTVPGRAAVLRQSAVEYSALGLDHGFLSHAVVCIRAPRAQGCPAG